MSQGNRTVIGFDYGMKSIGVAVGQEITGTASPVTALKAEDGIPDWQLISNLIDEWKPQVLVVGLPLNMDGTEQPFTANAKKFARRLAHWHQLPVELYDERLSTVDAKERLFAQGGYRNLEKGKIDAASACLITESWLARP